MINRLLAKLFFNVSVGYNASVTSLFFDEKKGLDFVAALPALPGIHLQVSPHLRLADLGRDVLEVARAMLREVSEPDATSGPRVVALRKDWSLSMVVARLAPKRFYIVLATVNEGVRHPRDLRSGVGEALDRVRRVELQNIAPGHYVHLSCTDGTILARCSAPQERQDYIRQHFEVADVGRAVLDKLIQRASSSAQPQDAFVGGSRRLEDGQYEVWFVWQTSKGQFALEVQKMDVLASQVAGQYPLPVLEVLRQHLGTFSQRWS